MGQQMARPTDMTMGTHSAPHQPHRWTACSLLVGDCQEAVQIHIPCCTIHDPVPNHLGIQLQFSGQFIDGHRLVECLENFEPPVVPIRELLDVALDRGGHPIPLLKFDQGLVCERGELIVTQAFDLGFEFFSDDIVLEAGLHEHIHVLDVVVAACDRLEQEDILVADRSILRSDFTRRPLDSAIDE
jgi:hypothetical protein